MDILSTVTICAFVISVPTTGGSLRNLMLLKISPYVEMTKKSSVYEGA
jgi:hypothetical protein